MTPAAGRRRALALAAALAAAGPAAAADCPVAALLDGPGIRLERTGPPFVATFRRERGKIVERRRMQRDGAQRESTTTYLNGLMPEIQTEAGGYVHLGYADPVPDIRTLPQAGQVEVGVKLTVNGTVTDRAGRVVLVHEGAGKLRIGGCTYPTWTVRVTTETAKNASVFRMDYSPDLDLVLRSTALDPQSLKPAAQVAFDRIARGGVGKT